MQVAIMFKRCLAFVFKLQLLFVFYNNVQLVYGRQDQSSTMQCKSSRRFFNYIISRRNNSNVIKIIILHKLRWLTL